MNRGAAQVLVFFKMRNATGTNLSRGDELQLEALRNLYDVARGLLGARGGVEGTASQLVYAAMGSLGARSGAVLRCAARVVRNEAGCAARACSVATSLSSAAAGGAAELISTCALPAP